MDEAASPSTPVWRHFLHSWKTQFGIQALCSIILVLIAGPLFTLTLQIALAASRKTVLSDTEILLFLTSPTGLLISLFLTAIWLSLQLLGYATQLFAAQQS
ncbi:MAG: hypothetical protein ACQKBU_05880, partial [Verrucomicrobiales bacterium]